MSRKGIFVAVCISFWAGHFMFDANPALAAANTLGAATGLFLHWAWND